MRAAVMQGKTIDVRTLPDPQPGSGKLLVKPFYTGICGSDLSLRKQMAEAEDAVPAANRDALPQIVPGHEFCAEIVDIPKATETAFRVGDLVTSIPFTHAHDLPQTIGLSPEFSGGLASLTCVDAMRSFAVPEGLETDLAALTEPLAVGLHAANLASRNKGPNVVIGCGPVGLATIFALKQQGRGPILAADLSPERSAIAEKLGADLIVNPAETSALDKWDKLGFTPSMMSPLLERDFRGLPPGANIFECTGVKGMLDQVVTVAPQHSHIIVVGVCPHQETVTPLEGIVRELTIEFSFAYRPQEFQAAMQSIAAQPDLARLFITSRRPLAETQSAFDALAKHPDEIKILINPQA